MNSKLKIIIGSLVLMFVTSINAQQDRHFSLFYVSPLELNPGAAGMFSGDVQFFTNYKNQWSSITPNLYKTITGSVDGKVYKNTSNGTFVGAGLGFYNDVAGIGKMKTNIYAASVSVGIEIADNQFLALGIRPGLFQRSIDYTNFTWSNQWNGTEFDAGTLPGESVHFGNIIKFDLNTGIYYIGNITENILVQGGLALHHVTRPSIGFSSSDETLYMKTVINARMVYIISHSKIGLEPNVLAFFQGPNKEITFGNDFKYYLKESSKYTGYFEETSLSLGVYYRKQDAIYTTFFFNTSGFSLGVAYDSNISGLKAATNGLGGMEFLLRYRIGYTGAYSSFR
jgi:type IX secretion system PorP/SprF family membrane protein